MQNKFSLGRIVATPNALNQVPTTEMHKAINRHTQGDWGDVDGSDRNANEYSLNHGERLLSVYHASNRVKFWIITEADRSSTCILLPEDY